MSRRSLNGGWQPVLNAAMKTAAIAIDPVIMAMHATSANELLAVADADEIMPPKSTWFEPKLRSGLFVHEFERIQGAKA